ncbi:MAG: hypothetical protein ABIJ37_02290 [Pseudomonadota bacterium]
MIYTNPLYGFIITLFLFLMGRVHFSKHEIGSMMLMNDGKDFVIFRRVIIKRLIRKDQKPEGLFIVRFTPKMDIKKNIRLSRIMLLVFMGFKGFRSKYWCVNEETGMCQGVYEWDKMADVERYSKSIAVKIMTKRSVPGSVSCKVLENTYKNQSWRIIDTKEDEKDKFKIRYNLT